MGLPPRHFATPIQVLGIPREERHARVTLTEDDCVIDGREFYLKGLLDIPVRGSEERITWGVWLSMSEESYSRFTELFSDSRRSAGEEFFDWICNALPTYPDTQVLKTYLHVREFPMRPWVEFEPTDHPLAADQRRTQRRARDRAGRTASSPAH